MTASSGRPFLFQIGQAGKAGTPSAEPRAGSQTGRLHAWSAPEERDVKRSPRIGAAAARNRCATGNPTNEGKAARLETQTMRGIARRAHPRRPPSRIGTGRAPAVSPRRRSAHRRDNRASNAAVSIIGRIRPILLHRRVHTARFP
ncbi:hypothetical protein [Burkholderia pseudomallei]|uniref:hypothetical protein n=1 Tax=Burkholderia pseudomallei TaxID=28450 RepID=UPI0006801A1A|nr:hypothetical protein [Burkholderia pseudomallei]